MKKTIYTDITALPLTDFGRFVIEEVAESLAVEDNTMAANMALLTEKVNEATTQTNRQLAFSQRMMYDRVRCRRLMSVVYIIKGHTGSGNDRIAAAAELISDITGRHKGIVRENINAKSADIRSLTDELLTDENAPHVALIPGLGDAISYLTAAEEDFEQATQDYIGFIVNKGRPLAIIRRELLILINKSVLPYIFIMAECDPENYGLLGSRIAEKVKNTNAIILARRTKRNKRRDKEENR